MRIIGIKKLPDKNAYNAILFDEFFIKSINVKQNPNIKPPYIKFLPNVLIKLSIFI